MVKSICPACQEPAHPFMRLERVVAAVFNGMVWLCSTLTFVPR